MLIAITCLPAGCQRDDPQSVVLYVSADEHVARKIIDEFQKQTGLRVRMVGDTEAKKTTGLVERLVAEADKPQADVFWSSEVFMTIDLAEKGVFDEHRSQVTADWPKQFCDPKNRWYGFAARARVIVYSPERVPADAVPKTWMGLTQSRFRGRIVMADPRFGTTGGHLGAMKAYWDREIMPGYYAAFCEGLAANGIRLLPSGNAGAVEAVARGEADLGLTDTDDVWAAQAQGWNVELVYPDHNAVAEETAKGTLVIPNTVARVKGGPHPDNARRLIDFLLSEQVERMLAESESHNIPVRAEIARGFPHYAVPDPLQVDYKAAADQRAKAIDIAMRRLRPRGSDEDVSSTEPAETQPDESPSEGRAPQTTSPTHARD